MRPTTAIPLARALPSHGGDTAAAGGDVENARRFYAGLSATDIFFVPLVCALAWPGGAGPTFAWALVLLWSLAHALNLLALVRSPAGTGWGYLLATQYVDLLGLVALQALAGGWAAPYDQLIMVHVLAVSLAFVPRRSIPYMLLGVAGVLSPIAYGETHGRAVEIVVMLALWGGLAVFGLALMIFIRRQRLTLAGEARVDALTDLENRRAFDEHTPAQLAAARAAGRPLLLGIGDVDRFKAINDRYGHQAGDVCLRGVATALRAACREGDRVFRWGGDEFAVVLEGASPDEVAKAGRRLQQRVAAAVHDPDGHPVRLTLGWAFDDGRGTAADLVAAADASLMAQKAERSAA